MKKLLTTRALFALTLLGAIILATLFGSSVTTSTAAAPSAVREPSSPIRITPPAPVFDQKERLAELASRRARVASAIGPKAVMILFSTEPRIYTNDVEYEYRQENNLYYLTMLKQKRATLLLMPGNSRLHEILFLPRREPFLEVWSGHMYSVEEAYAASGVSPILDAREFEPFIKALASHQPYQPKPENVLMTKADSSATPTGQTGFEGLFGAAEKGEGELY